MNNSQSTSYRSKCLEAFKKIKEAQKGNYHLVGDVLLVEKIPGQELVHEVRDDKGNKVAKLYLAGGQDKKIDGLDMNLPVFVTVLDAGAGFYDAASEREEALGSDIGNVILVGRMSVTWFSVFGRLVSTREAEIGICRDVDARMRFKDEASYNDYFNMLNETLLQVSNNG